MLSVSFRMMTGSKTSTQTISLFEHFSAAQFHQSNGNSSFSALKEEYSFYTGNF